mgnify:CR=1 FL=1
MNIAEASIQKRTVTLVMTALLLIGGLLSFNNLSRLEDPEFTIKEALVITRYDGATPVEVEQEVTEVIETEIQKLEQLKEVSSISYAGLSIITVEIQDKYDKHTLPAVWEQLRRKINDVEARLPPGVSKPVVRDDFGDVFGILLALTGDGFTAKELQDHADDLKRELLLVDGVAKISLWGEQQEAIFVEISRARLAQLGISQDQVYSLLSRQNLVSPAGKVRSGRDYIRIEPTGGINAVSDIENLLLRGPSTGSNLKPIYLKDVATVSRSYIEPAENIMLYNGQPAVSLGISTASGGNVVTMGTELEKRMAELQADTPIGLESHVIYMQPKMVTTAIDNFIVSLGQAIAIVIVVLLAFMGLRSGLLIGAILLITVVATFILMKLNGVALERISLGALVIALGMLVDNAIVVTEGMLIRIQQGEDRIQAAKAVVNQTMWPLFGATVIAILAFAGIGLSQDATGEFTRSLYQVILYSLGLSWVIAITITPLFCVMFLKGPKPGETVGNPEDAYNGAVFRIYRRFLTGCIKVRWLTMTVMVGMLAAAVYGFGYVEQSFFPKSTMAKFMVHYWLPEGSDIRQTRADVQQIEDKLLADERVESTSSFIGAGAPRFLLTYAAEKTNSSYGFILVGVKDYQQIDQMMAEYGNYLFENFPDAEPKMEKFKLGPGGGSSLEVRFNGPDITVLRQLSEQAKEIYRQAGAIAVRDDWRQRVKVVHPVYSESRGQFAGITRSDLNTALNTNFTGSSVGVYRENDDLIPIVARAPAAERLDIAQIQDLQVWSPVYQRTVPITQVVNGFDTGWSDAQIHRMDRKRTITVGAEPASGNASVVFKKIKSKLEAIEVPAGYQMEFGGEYENSKNAQEPLAAKMPLVFGMMILITIILFNSLRHPLIIWLTVPLALVGVTAGLLGTGQSFGFMPLLGFLSLTGMLIKNAIVLIDEINIQLAEGKAPMTAVLDAAVSRSRPVAMAAGTTVLGMIPLLVDDFFIGMAVTIMAGLTFASILTLIVVPVLYVIVFRVKQDSMSKAAA